MEENQRVTTGLPISAKRGAITSALKTHRVVIISGATGCGKSTQLPQFCLQAGRASIAVSQPRRIAATSIARRVAQELRSPLGDVAGYQIRFSQKIGRRTKITFMTDGVLLRLAAADRRLSRFDTVIIDEAHERSLNIDFLLGLLRMLMQKRKDLKLIISSATLDTKLFAKAFTNVAVINVEGRSYPVDVWYRPLEEIERETDSASYVDAAVHVAREIGETPERGDMLIFMPTERDIRETANALAKSDVAQSIVLPLYGRMPQAQQQRIFMPSKYRKIVIATNVAETSLTVPGIRYVIDTGLARIRRYVPRLRTNRLPIEAVSQASAEQRKGRCGRVAEGLCIRLYSEKDFESREAFTLPEIKRSNLAGVILQMTAMGIGDAEDFPFIEPPSPRAVKDGYALLFELGALDRRRCLTGLGKEMARLPLDPHIARMIFEAQKNNAVRDVAIIAAGLSVVDPRERPGDKKAEADTQHKRFSEPHSDFLSYVKLWDTYQDEWERLGSQSRMRRFCKQHFLSYNRMREWHDVYEQIEELLRRHHHGQIKHNRARDDAIHRSILSGLISSIAMLQDDGSYRAARGRTAYVFPGSALARKKPPWIVCHEIVETSRVFARTVAAIKPEWLEELAPYLCSSNYSEPFFDETSGTVKAKETVILFGLPIVKGRTVGYGTKNREEASGIFIREGLVDEKLRGNYRFIRKNRGLRSTIETAEAKLRRQNIFAGEEAMVDFYKKKLGEAVSVHELNKEIKKHNGDRFLLMNESDITAGGISDEIMQFPDSISIGAKTFPVRYKFSPGQQDDGITIEISADTKPFIANQLIEKAINPLLINKIQFSLKALPKNIRKLFHPIDKAAQKLAIQMKEVHSTYEKALKDCIKRSYNIEISISELAKIDYPDHLNIHFSSKQAAKTARRFITNDKSSDYSENEPDWNQAFKRFEKTGLTDWNIGELQDKIEVISDKSGLPLYGYPALVSSKNSVDLKLFSSKEKAEKAHKEGVQRLLQLALYKELAWIEKDLSFGQDLKLFCASIGGWQKVRANIIRAISDEFLCMEELPWNKLDFNKLTEEKRSLIKNAGIRALEVLERTQQNYSVCLDIIAKNMNKAKSRNQTLLGKDLQKSLEAYHHRLADNSLNFNMLFQYARYIKAFEIRISRAFNNTDKYRKNIALLEKYANVGERLSAKINNKRISDLLDFIEELAISLFAQQEVGTRYPVSEKRLGRLINSIEESLK